MDIDQSGCAPALVKQVNGLDLSLYKNEFIYDYLEGNATVDCRVYCLT